MLPDSTVSAGALIPGSSNRSTTLLSRPMAAHPQRMNSVAAAPAWIAFSSICFPGSVECTPADPGVAEQFRGNEFAPTAVGRRGPARGSSLMDDLAAHHRHHRLDVLDLLGGNGQVVPVEHDEIDVLARLDRTSIALLKE